MKKSIDYKIYFKCHNTKEVVANGEITKDATISGVISFICKAYESIYKTNSVKSGIRDNELIISIDSDYYMIMDACNNITINRDNVDLESGIIEWVAEMITEIIDKEIIK